MSVGTEWYARCWRTILYAYKPYPIQSNPVQPNQTNYYQNEQYNTKVHRELNMKIIGLQSPFICLQHIDGQTNT